MLIRPGGYITYFRLNSAEHEIYPSHNIKMLMIVGILAFISMINTSSESLYFTAFLLL